MSYVEKRFQTADGLDLYYRDYTGSAERLPLLCLTGLTRNSKDYDDFARRIAPTRRVICPDYRGRGRSAYDPKWQNYAPPTYVGDTLALMAATGLKKVVVVGTSLGGIVSMGLAAAAPQVLAGVILNDIGPDLNAAGLARIADYVGAEVRIKDMASAAYRLKTMMDAAYPDLSESDWLRFADRVFVADTERGDLRLDYDLAIATPFKEAAKSATPPFDLWPLFRHLRDIPTLAIRGGLSDLLSAETFAAMAVDMPHMTQLTVPNRGHVPLLDEPECVAVIDAFLTKL